MVKLDNGLNPASKNIKLDNGIGKSAADFEEDYERRGDASKTNTGKQGGNEGEKLSRKMNKRYGEYR